MSRDAVRGRSRQPGQIDGVSTYVSIAANVTYLGTATSTDSAGTSDISVSYTQVAGSNRIAMAVVCANTIPSTVTYSGSAMTLIYSTDVDGAEYVSAYRLLEASLGADGAKTVTAQFDATPNSIIQVFMCQNASQGAPESTQAATNSATTDLSVTLTSTAGAMAFTGFSCANPAATITHGTGQTEILENTSALGAVASSYESIAAASSPVQSSIQSGVATRCALVGWSIAKAP